MSIYPSGTTDFWHHSGRWPADIRFVLLETITTSATGPDAFSVDRVRMESPAGSVYLLARHEQRVEVADVERIKGWLVSLITSYKISSREKSNKQIQNIIPAIVTQTAHTSLARACLDSDVALVDHEGTVLVRGPSVYVHIERGKASHRQRSSPFLHGKQIRIIRRLLTGLTQGDVRRPHHSIEQLAKLSGTSYPMTRSVLISLEKQGFVARGSQRSGFYVRSPFGLLRAWMESVQETTFDGVGYYAPSTTSASLLEAARAHERHVETPPLFSLASALLEDEVHASGLPHAAYLKGDISAFADALKLMPKTPHNFFILRPEPEPLDGFMGLSTGARQLSHGQGVAIPQLAADFSRMGGRCKEQAQFLLELFSDRIGF